MSLLNILNILFVDTKYFEKKYYFFQRNNYCFILWYLKILRSCVRAWR